MIHNPLIVISTSESGYFGNLVAELIGADIIEIERKLFGGIEKYLRIAIEEKNDLFGKTVVLVSSTHSDEEIEEVYRLGCAISGYGAKRIIFCLPFLGYSTMERAVKPGEVVTAKTIARKLSSIPSGDYRNTFLLMDLHVGGFVHYFEGNCARFELVADELLLGSVHKLNFNSHKLVVASADLGRPKVIARLAKSLGGDVALINKARDGENTEVLSVIGSVEGCDVIINDDMTRSAGTMLDSACAYRDCGATSVSAMLSHLALNNPEIAQRLLDSNIDHIITTNSHPASQWDIVSDNPDRFTIVDASPLFANIISNITGQGVM